MSLLGVNYGSDASDDDNEAPTPTPAAPAPAWAAAPAPPKPPTTAAPIAPTSSSSGKGSNKKPKKKKAKIALSILPPEIQAALARAPVKGMDDDEDDDLDGGGVEEELDEVERARRRKIRQQVAETKAIEGRRAAGAKGLFALLPKPKAEEALENAIAANAAPKKKEPAKPAAPIKKPEPEPEPEKEEASSDSDSEEDDEEGEGGGGLLHPSLLAGAKAAVLPRVSMVNIAPSVSSAPAVPTSVPAEEQQAAAAVAEPSTVGGGGVGGEQAADYEAQWAAYYAAQAQAQGRQQGQEGQGEMDPETARQWQEYYYAQQQQQQQGVDVGMEDMGGEEEEELDEFGRPKQTSRRDKIRARQALLQGDIGALGQLAKGAQVASVAAPQEKWDPFRHGPPKKQEKVRIAAAFYDSKSGETVTVQDASRTHKRKHHINSLAIQAAEREAELMEGRSRGMLTKAQTQGKYGW